MAVAHGFATDRRGKLMLPPKRLRRVPTGQSGGRRKLRSAADDTVDLSLLPPHQDDPLSPLQLDESPESTADGAAPSAGSRYGVQDR